MNLPNKSILKLILADSLRWSKDEALEVSQIASSMIGMAGPIILGALNGNLGFGLLASLGAMIVSGASAVGTMRNRAKALLSATVAGTSAVFTGSLITGHGWLTAVLLIFISALAALLGGISRPAAIASTQFILFMIIGTGIQAGEHYLTPTVMAFIFALGSFWGMIVSLFFMFLLNSTGIRLQSPPTDVIPFIKRLKYWKHTLSRFNGWQYTLRVTLCLTAAEIIGIFLHQEKSYWISLTVAIILQRNLSSAFTRTFQRGIGTAAGVLLGSILLFENLPEFVTLFIISIIAALRPIFKKRNYTIYAMLMTPLIITLFNLGGKVTASLLFQRLIDTFIGCTISLALGYFIWPNRNSSKEEKKNPFK